jgi:hypothetical protein
MALYILRQSFGLNPRFLSTEQILAIMCLTLVEVLFPSPTFIYALANWLKLMNPDSVAAIASHT